MYLMWARMYLTQYVIIIINATELSVAVSLIWLVKYGSLLRCTAL